MTSRTIDKTARCDSVPPQQDFALQRIAIAQRKLNGPLKSAQVNLRLHDRSQFGLPIRGTYRSVTKPFRFASEWRIIFLQIAAGNKSNPRLPTFLKQFDFLSVQRRKTCPAIQLGIDLLKPEFRQSNRFSPTDEQ